MFLQTLGASKNFSKPNLVQRQSLFKLCNILANPSASYGCEIWTLKQSDIRRQQTAEMEFMRHTVGYGLLNCTRNGDF